MTTPRTATVRRETSESSISLSLNLDGTGRSSIDTSVPFFTHMLTAFAKQIAAGGPVTSLGLKNTVSPAFQIGADIALGGHWVANVDVKQTLIQTTAKISGGALHAHTHLDPTLVGFGVGYRF